jgi:3-methyl-2-oxobutanoate hydroxymethyltransferase
VKIQLPALAEMKLKHEPIVMITAYDHPSAVMVDTAGVDLVLVGDSAANTVLGHDSMSTLRATMDELLILTRAVARGCERAIVIGDLPFMSYQVSDEDAVRNGGRFIKEAGADVVKLEGAGNSVRRAAALVSAGIPVMGHVGLTPQTVTMLGGHRAQGRDWHRARQLYEDAIALQAAGCFAIVLEAVPEPVAAAITRRLAIPTIGIGSGAVCDGQVLVFHDADVGGLIRQGVAAYAAEVRAGTFPGPEHSYSMPADELSAFEAAISATPVEDNILADW